MAGWVHEKTHVEDLALPNFVESGKLSVNKVGVPVDVDIMRA
jgi:hypothetical protein